MLLVESVLLQRAVARFAHLRPKDWRKNPKTGLLEPDYRWRDSPIFGPQGEIDPDSAELVWEGDGKNVITNSGRDYMHAQCYGTSGGAANGFCYIGLSNDALTETTASTTLSNEIAANGLSRAVGVYAHTNGTNTSTISKTFTCTTTSQAAQKAALFTAASSGTMNHALAFTQRTLQVGDSLATMFTGTLG